MKVAVTYQNGEIFQHFGHTEQFKLYEVEDYQMIDSKIVDTNGSGHGALATFLKNQGVQVLICGGIGGGAKEALAKVGIKLYGGVSGKADKKVEELIKGILNYNPDVACSNHKEQGEHHNCHSQGNHSCHSHQA